MRTRDGRGAFVKEKGNVVRFESDHVAIVLGNGIETLVDFEDYERLRGIKIFASGRKGRRYAQLTVDGKDVLLHRYLLRPPRDKVIDHINRSGLDNRRKNLRVCTHRLNLRNTAHRKSITSPYRGVSWSKGCSKWCSRLTIGHTSKTLGYFDNAEVAAAHYNIAARELLGEFAYITVLEVSAITNDVEFIKAKHGRSAEAYDIRRRRAISRQTPSWADEKQIEEIYNTASRQGLHVDHIVPLISPVVCGLHCQNNLRIVTPTENFRKGNKLIEDLAIANSEQAA
jgi:hypothetical protein